MILAAQNLAHRVTGLEHTVHQFRIVLGLLAFFVLVAFFTAAAKK